MRYFIVFLLINLLSPFSYASCVNIDFFTRFNDIYFENYIKEALDNNHSLKEANYKIEQYRANIKTQFAKQLPNLSVGSNYLGTHLNNDRNGFLSDKSAYILPFLVNFEPDFLLKNRDKTKSVQKLLKAQMANQKAVYISLLTDVANAYVNILLLDYILDKQSQIVENETKNLNIDIKKLKYGVLDINSLLKSKQNLRNQEIILSNLIKLQKQTLYNFMVLLGKSPNCIQDIKRGKLEDFEYQQSIPEIICSDLIYNRPDIEELEYKLRSARLDISVAKKEFFPKFNVTGFLAFDTAGSGNFFSWNSSIAYLVAGLTQDLFKGGEKIANLKFKKARFKELLESYFQTDLIALKELNNALNLIKQDKNSEKLSKMILENEKNKFENTLKKFKRGTISKTKLIEDKKTYLQKEQLFANSKATRLMDYFTLYKVLGGQL